MKKPILYLILLFSYNAGQGQNLVPNPNFELYSICPPTYTKFEGYVLTWTNPSSDPFLGSPDYFNTCATPASLVDVPDNGFGYQFPHSGDAYCGITLWSSAAVHREYIQVQLTSTLEEKECYQFEMYVNLANEYKYLASNLGVYFTSTPITGVPNALPLPVTPQIDLSGFTTDTLSWTLLSGNYTAQGNENYLIIGNFNDDASTNVSFVNLFGVQNHSYIFVDDVSLTLCGPTSISEKDENALFTIYPNPVMDHQLQIISAVLHDNGGLFEMYDVNGRKVYSVHLPEWNSSVIDLPEVTQGIYQCVITNGNNRLIKIINVITK